MNSKAADWAAEAGSVDWANVRNKPSSSSTDISQISASGFTRGQLPQWSGKRFIGVNASSLIDTSGFFSLSNKPYNIYQFTWTPGTLTPFLRTKNTFTISGVTEGTPVVAGIPYSLDGVLTTVNVIDDEVEVVLFNSTPYDITLDEGVFQFLAMK